MDDTYVTVKNEYSSYLFNLIYSTAYLFKYASPEWVLDGLVYIWNVFYNFC